MENSRRALLNKWAIVLVSGLAIEFIGPPSGIDKISWRLLAIFIATIVGSIVRPISSGAIVLFGVAAMALTNVMPVGKALAGFADPIVWLVLAAFFISRGMIKTGLGRRIALLFIRTLGKRSLGLGYALIGSDMVLASVIPSNGARAGGIIFPIAKSLAEAYDSRPDDTARRLGAFLLTLIYQCDVIICATFLTGQASNALIAKFAKQATGIDLTYSKWLIGAILPCLISLLVVPLLIYKVFPPEVKYTPAASEFAATELRKMGPTTWQEKLMMSVFILIGLLWMTKDLHGIDSSVVALVGICALLLSGILEWDDLISEKGAWDVFIWYGGLVRMAEALSETGITKMFAETAAKYTAGYQWWLALAILALIYFYVHYAFASITAHSTAMYTPFLVVIVAAGAPTYIVMLLLAYFSNLSASLTHYGTTPAPIYFGAGYVKQRMWWQIGFLVSIPNIIIWSGIGFLWWKILGWW